VAQITRRETFRTVSSEGSHTAVVPKAEFPSTLGRSVILVHKERADVALSMSRFGLGGSQ
jgi:hypothetical protein